MRLPAGVSVGFPLVDFTARSCEHHSEAKVFPARILRFSFELLFVVILTAFVFGPLFQRFHLFAEYSINPQTYKYSSNGAFNYGSSVARVFTNNPSGDVVNAALDTSR